jgi:eukaryotic-like serine/threonine-protein kinase
MTSGERAERLADLVKAAVERGPEHWNAFLDEECKSDPAMRAEIDSLLKHQKHVEQFIEPSALDVAAASFLHDGADRAGQMIEDYQVLSRLGIGGMGEVYLAQDTKLRRKVALKLVRAGMDTSEIVARFGREEQILASFNHPNIAQLYGAGVAGGDVPFLVMEYVEGVRIDEYCKAKMLSTTVRLELFRKVCSAVLYAHQRLIIHRDLKPSNILVTADGEPKLLDFGIAKLLEGQDAFTRLQTTLPGVMTPDYASPEQVRGEAMTTWTDVYSLGVLLYEILTGQRPYRLKTRSPDEIARAITDQEPERPSTAIARGDGNSKFETRNSRFPKGDLDNIVLMALRKEPARRYASVGQFSEDIRRYLEGLPVLAHKDTFSYRAKKFIKRNKIGVAAAAAIVLTLLGGIIATAWQAKRATDQARIAAEQARFAAQQRDRARVEAAKAARINDFLQNVLGFVSVGYLSPNPQKKNVATIAEALDEASRRAERELADQPEILAAVQSTLGGSYAGQGKIDLAEKHNRASLDIRRKVLGPEHPDTAQSMVELAAQLVAQGKYPETEALSREAVAIYRRLRERGEMNPRWFALSLNILGVTLSYRGDSQTAEALMREAVEVGANLTGIDRGLIATIYSNLAIQRGNQGDIEGAVDYLQKAIEEMRRLPDKPLTNLANSLSNLGSFMTIKGEHAQADAVLREAEELCRNTVGEKHYFTAMAIIYLADNSCEQGDFNRALGEINRAIAIQREILQEGHIDFARSWTILGKILTRAGEPARGEEHLRNALALRAKALKPGHSATAFTQAMLGECLAAQKRFEEAETLLLESHTAMNKAMGANDPRTRRARARLFKLYEAWGKPEQAAAYRG